MANSLPRATTSGSKPAASTLYAIPVLAALVAWPWLGESPAAPAVAGGAVAIGGVALTARARRS